jgi:hypothetical protein
MPVILATQETESRRTAVWSQPEQIVHETLSGKKPSQKRAGGGAQSVGLEFKLQYWKINKYIKSYIDDFEYLFIVYDFDRKKKKHCGLLTINLLRLK